jgi:hypothetical protein
VLQTIREHQSDERPGSTSEDEGLMTIRVTKTLQGVSLIIKVIEQGQTPPSLEVLATNSSVGRVNQTSLSL